MCLPLIFDYNEKNKYNEDNISIGILWVDIIYAYIMEILKYPRKTINK